MSAVLLLLDPDSIGDGLWAQERGLEDIGITVTPRIPSAETSEEENLNRFFTWEQIFHIFYHARIPWPRISIVLPIYGNGYLHNQDTLSFNHDLL
jgi:hypothetical protein